VDYDDDDDDDNNNNNIVYLPFFGNKIELFCTFLFFLIIPWSRVLLEKLTGSQLVKIFLAFYGTQMFITALTCPYPQINPVHSSPQSYVLKILLNSLLSTPGSSKWPLSLRFPQEYPVQTSSLPIRATCPAHLFLLVINSNDIWWEYRSLSSSLYSFFHCPIRSFLLTPSIHLSTQFWNTLSLRPSLNVSYHVSYPYKTTGKILVPYILIFIFLNRKLEDKRSCTEW